LRIGTFLTTGFHFSSFSFSSSSSVAAIGFSTVTTSTVACSVSSLSCRSFSSSAAISSFLLDLICVVLVAVRVVDAADNSCLLELLRSDVKHDGCNRLNANELSRVKRAVNVAKTMDDFMVADSTLLGCFELVVVVRCRLNEDIAGIKHVIRGSKLVT